MFLCSSTSHGAVTELRYGLQAHIRMILPYRTGVNQIWSAPDPTGTGIFLICSFAFHTEVLRISSNFLRVESPSVEQLFEEDVYGLELGARTLAAGMIGTMVIQITSKTIRAISSSSSDSGKILRFSYTYSNNDNILDAAIHSDSATMVIGVRKGEQVLLHVVQLRVEER